MPRKDRDDSERNVYHDEVREDLVDDDEISAEEEAFMRGYDEAEEDEDKDEDE